MCFCTKASLQFLKHPDNEKKVLKFLHIGEPVIEKLVADFKIDEKTASEKFYSSATFSKLADASTRLCEKNWREVYDLFLKEF